MTNRIVTVGDNFTLPASVKVADANLPDGAKPSNVAGKVEKAAIIAASDPLAYLNTVAILCEFPVRENGETLWPQGISINKADNELYVSNADGPAAVLRIDIRDLTTGARKSSKQISVTGPAWSEGLPWFKNTNGDLCFIVRTTPETGVTSTYSIFNYTTNTLGSPIAINGPFKSDVNGDTFITSDAYSHTATKFFIYSWASIQAGMPSLLATVPLENPGQDIGKTQNIAIVGSNLYILTGDQSTNPGILVYDFTGKLLAIRDYGKADFQAAVNVLKPGYLTNNAFVYECEGATNLDGKLVTGQIVNNNPAVTADGKMLVLQHNRIDGSHIKARPLANFVRDTGWVTLTPATGWTIGGGVNIQARRIGNEVRLRGQPLNGSAAGATFVTVATLPAGMIPPASVQFSQSSNTTATMAVRVNNTGTIECWSSVVTSSWRPLNGITFLLD